MDFLKKAAGSLGGNKPANTAGQPGQPAEQKPDYVDKGLSFVQKKMGMQSNPKMNETITDAGRSYYEKSTGKKVDPKISN